MTKQSRAQKKTMERVMHEFKHGELKSGAGKKVKNPKQAIAIGLHEAGASKYESPKKNARNLQRTKRRERTGKTAKARSEGLSGRNSARGGEKTRAELYREAQRRKIPGRSHMNKGELQRALRR